MTSGQAPNPPRVPPSSWRSLLWLLGLVLMLSYLAQLGQEAERQTLSYTAFKASVEAGEVASVTLQGDHAVGELAAKASGDSEAGPPRSFVTTLPPVTDPDLLPLLERHDVEVNARSTRSPWWVEAIVGLLPWLLVLGLVWYAARKMQEGLANAGRGGPFGFAKSRARRFSRGQSAVTFADVAGLDNAKRDLREITSYLQAPERFRRLGAKIPKGVLLTGPPGTGKTLLAKAVAGEASVPFFSISGSEFIEMFVGVGASRVRDMFESAKKDAPAIIFVDEIDSVGRARGTGLGGGHDEREQTLNQILNEMDGFAPHEAVVVLAATNRPDVLDPALLRPGRFDRKVVLDLPDRRARREILAIHARRVPLANDADLDRLAALTVGLSGAELENLVNEAALLAGRDEKSEVDMRQLLNARDKIVLGGPREMVVSDAQKRLTACHEAGHAIAASHLPQADPLDKVTIVPRGLALGATAQVPGEDRYSLRESYLRDRIGVMLAGRVAEQLMFGEVSSGTEQDLEQATRLARYMVTRWGMSRELGPVAFSRGDEHVFLGREMVQQREFSEHTARLIDDETRRLVGEIEAEIRELLENQRPELEALADALFESETLEEPEIRSIIEQAGEERENARRAAAIAEV